ncbi:MAG: LiaF transmembrane domain-containing protein [Senegalia sp. (in: firmicutes)]|uniref:LiaF transmembrane domain-containing protein n=1 Tax=Senegalia sp. (in: firmicutes) TaxID=1924098 RepID=UPI003F97278D
MDKKILGIIIILIGVLLLLTSNGILDLNIGYIISNFWPMILIGAGLFSLITNKASKVGGAIVLTIGVLFQLRNLDYFDIFEYLEFWPVIIIIIGISLIFSNKDKWNKDQNDSIKPIAIFSGLNLRNTSNNFKGGSATVLFGGIELDLQEANIDHDKIATLDVFVAFGGLDMVVPEGWNVEIKGLPLFGGWDNKTRNKGNTNLPKLKINAVVLFGGVDVKDFRKKNS